MAIKYKKHYFEEKCMCYNFSFLQFYNDFNFKSKIKVLGQSASTEEIRSSSNTMIINYWSSAGHRGFKLRYTAQAPARKFQKPLLIVIYPSCIIMQYKRKYIFPIVIDFYITIIKNIRRNIYNLLIFLNNVLPAACGGNLRQLEGNITGPTSLPFNQTSYACYWILEPPESMVGSISDNRLTLTIKVTGYLGRSENRAGIIRKNCIRPQFIELQGKIKNTIQFLNLIHFSLYL